MVGGEQLRPSPVAHSCSLVVRGRHDPRGPIQHRPEVVTVSAMRDPRVNPHANRQRTRRTPRLAEELQLRVGCRRHRGPGRREHRMHAVARRLDHVPTVRLDGAAQDGIVAGQRPLHRLGMLLPEARRALEIGEQERHRPCRELAHERSPSCPGASTPGHRPQRRAIGSADGGRSFEVALDARAHLGEQPAPTPPRYKLSPRENRSVGGGGSGRRRYASDGS